MSHEQIVITLVVFSLVILLIAFNLLDLTVAGLMGIHFAQYPAPPAL